MGFYDMKETPVPGFNYKRVATNSDASPIVEVLRNHAVKLCCCPILCAFLVSICILIVPCTPALNSMGKQIRRSMAIDASNVTGVDVDIDYVGLSLLQADIYGFKVSNPPGFASAPFFMKCHHIRSQMNWRRLFQSRFSFVEVTELTLSGLDVYLDQKVGFMKKRKSNANVITAHIGEYMHHLSDDDSSGNWVEEIATDMKRRYTIQSMNVKDMLVHILLGSHHVKTYKVPPMVVQDIGMKQDGVNFEVLFDLVMESLAAVASDGAQSDAAEKLSKTIKELSD